MIRLVLATLALLPQAAARDPGPIVVRLKTADGLVLEADWYRGTDGFPGIVGLHMYPADRSSWRSLAEARPEGFHFLAVDMRGYGGSRVQDGVDLGERVAARDSALFQAMWRDAAACVEFLRTKARCHPRRIGLVGASVGCSVAIDAAVRDGGIAGVAVLTPGTDYLGVPTLEHLKGWKDTPLLLLSSEEEAGRGARPLAEALVEQPGVELRIVPGERVHGTRMFGAAEGIEASIASWFEEALEKQILDGEEDAVEHGRYEVRLSSSSADRGSTVWGRSGGIAALFEEYKAESAAPGIEIIVAHGPWESGPPAGARRLRGKATSSGTLVEVRLLTWNGEAWNEQARPDMPDTAIRKGGTVEVRFPWTALGVGRGTTVHFGVRFAAEEPLDPPSNAVDLIEMEVN